MKIFAFVIAVLALAAGAATGMPLLAGYYTDATFTTLRSSTLQYSVDPFELSYIGNNRNVRWTGMLWPKVTGSVEVCMNSARKRFIQIDAGLGAGLETVLNYNIDDAAVTTQCATAVAMASGSAYSFVFDYATTSPTPSTFSLMYKLDGGSAVALPSSWLRNHDTAVHSYTGNLNDDFAPPNFVTFQLDYHYLPIDATVSSQPAMEFFLAANVTSQQYVGFGLRGSTCTSSACMNLADKVIASGAGGSPFLYDCVGTDGNTPYHDDGAQLYSGTDAHTAVWYTSGRLYAKFRRRITPAADTTSRHADPVPDVVNSDYNMVDENTPFYGIFAFGGLGGDTNPNTGGPNANRNWIIQHNGRAKGGNLFLASADDAFPPARRTCVAHCGASWASGCSCTAACVAAANCCTGYIGDTTRGACREPASQSASQSASPSQSASMSDSASHSQSASASPSQSRSASPSDIKTQSQSTSDVPSPSPSQSTVPSSSQSPDSAAAALRPVLLAVVLVLAATVAALF